MRLEHAAACASLREQVTRFISTTIQILTLMRLPGVECIEARACGGMRKPARAGTQFTCFTGKKVQILTHEGCLRHTRASQLQQQLQASSEFTCLTGTKVQILTPFASRRHSCSSGCKHRAMPTSQSSRAATVRCSIFFPSFILQVVRLY